MNRETKLMRLGWFWWVGCKRTDGRFGFMWRVKSLLGMS